MDEATHKQNYKPIVLRDLFREKNPALARWIPGFVYRFLSRILRIDFMNSILYHHGCKKDVDFARGVIEDGPWQKSIIAKARQTKRDIVPIHVSGRNSHVFYNLANLRKFLGIKANLEMFFLPNESYHHKDKHFVITFGKPIPHTTFDARMSPVDWAEEVRKHTYRLPGDPESSFPYQPIDNLAHANEGYYTSRS